MPRAPKILPFTFLSLALQAHSATLYTEIGAMDLGDNAFNPSALGALSQGDNTISGVINEGGAFKPDVFSFTIDSDLQLTSLTFEFSSDLSSHFLAFKDSSGAFDHTDTILFAALVSSAQNNLNILEIEQDGGDVAEDSGLPRPLGFDLPLPSGEYTLWFQETSNETVSYTFNLTTVSIPEPTSLSASCLGLFLLLQLRREKP